MFKALLDPQGYSDGGKTAIYCDKCDVALLTVWSVKPDDTEEVNYISAICPLCGEKTEELEIKGKFYTAIGENGISDDFISYDSETDEEDNRTIFTLEKAD